jgi:hypothetical protein
MCEQNSHRLFYDNSRKNKRNLHKKVKMDIQKPKTVMWLFGLFIVLSGIPGIFQPVPALAQKPEVRMVPGTIQVGASIETAVLQALVNGSSVLPDVTDYAVTGLREDGKWLFVSVVGLTNLASDLQWNLSDNGAWVGLVLLYNLDNNQYFGAVEGTIGFSNLLATVPENILSAQAKHNLDPRLRPDISIMSTANRFPWETGTKMRYGVSGVHDNGFNGVVSG